MLIDSRAARSACPPQPRSGTIVQTGTRSSTTFERRAEPGSRTSARERTLRLRRQGHGVDVNILEVPSSEPHDDVAQAEVSVIPGNASEDTLRTEQDCRKQQPLFLCEVLVLRVIRGWRDPTDEDIAQHGGLRLPSRSCCVQHRRSTLETTGHEKQMLTHLQLNPMFLTRSKKRRQRPCHTVPTLLDRSLGGAHCTVCTKVYEQRHS